MAADIPGRVVFIIGSQDTRLSFGKDNRPDPDLIRLVRVEHGRVETGRLQLRQSWLHRVSIDPDVNPAKGAVLLNGPHGTVRHVVRKPDQEGLGRASVLEYEKATAAYPFTPPELSRR